MADAPAGIQLLESGLYFAELPLLSLHVGGNRLSREERFRALGALRQEVQAVLGARVETNGEGYCAHLYTLSHRGGGGGGERVGGGGVGGVGGGGGGSAGTGGGW